MKVLVPVPADAAKGSFRLKIMQLLQTETVSFASPALSFH